VPRTPAQIFALVLGVAFLAAGVLGFFVSADFSVGEAVIRPESRGTLLGLDVNGWHNVVHVVTGLVALSVVGRYHAARVFAVVIGVVYALVALLGILAGDPGVLLGLVPVNTADNLLHGAVALLGLVLGLATPATRAPTTV
jgi:hypothetical protein